MESRRASEVAVPGFEQASQKNERTIVEAEKFKAMIVQLQEQGKTDLVNFPNIGSGVSDDDFFHLTCHIEPSLIHKIENGEFVELEKLLPKDKYAKNVGDDHRLEWVQHDGSTYLVQLNVTIRSVVSENGSKPSELMLPFIVVPILKGQKKFGSTLQ